MNRIATYTDRTDPDLERRVKLFLSQVGRQSLNQLHVRVDKGVVFLQGRVSSFYERQLAISACQRVAGTYKVTEKVEVQV